MFTLPKSANHFSINTNSRDLDYQVSTKAIYQIIRNNPQGLTLTEIAQKVDPNWSTFNCKRMFKQAIEDKDKSSFITSFANQHFPDVQRAIKEGEITKEDAVKYLNMGNRL